MAVFWLEIALMVLFLLLFRFPSSFGLETRVSRIYVILAECQSSYSSFQALSL